MGAVFFYCCSLAHSNQLEGLVETRILDFDPQNGVKSQHFFFIDFEDQKVTSSYETGTTDFFGVKLDSVRDNFTITNVRFQGDDVSFTITGTTATGVGVVPNIDYKFVIYTNKSGKGTVEGCHDGYPAYLIQFNGNNIYRFNHKPKNILNLFGSCDIRMKVDM